MALIANVSFSKKVPVDGQDYSSQGYSLSLQTEINESDPAAIQARLHDTFELVKRQVETELANGNGRGEQARYDRKRDAGGSSPNSPAKATNRQINYLTSLASESGISISELNARVRELYGAENLYDLSKRDASRLLDDLKRLHKKAA